MSLLERPEAQELLDDADVAPGAVRGCADRLTRYLARYLPLFGRTELREHARLAVEGRPDVQISGDSGSDLTRLAELGKYCEADRRRRIAPPPLPPDPQSLARDYLTKAGYHPAELEGVVPLLRSASGHSKFEKQMTAPAPARPWTQ